MRKTEFLDTLRHRLVGLPPDEVEELIGDYAMHFADGEAAGRSEEEIATALGDPMRLARELRAEAGFRRWEARRTPSNLLLLLFGILGLLAVDFVFLLPVLAGLLFFTLAAAIMALFFCLIGLLTTFGLLDPFGIHTHSLFTHMSGLTVGLIGISLMGFGVGGGALLVLMVDWLVRVLGRYARLHYTLLGQVELAH